MKTEYDETELLFCTKCGYDYEADPNDIGTYFCMCGRKNKNIDAALKKLGEMKYLFTCHSSHIGYIVYNFSKIYCSRCKEWHVGQLLGKKEAQNTYNKVREDKAEN